MHQPDQMGGLRAESSTIRSKPSTPLQSLVAQYTTMLWDTFCLIRLSIQYRGRAIPLIWRVLRHGSSSVSFERYQLMLKRAARLVPAGVSVRFLADRGFADTKLMRYLREDLLGFFTPNQSPRDFYNRFVKMDS
jgi:hypothetical protein